MWWSSNSSQVEISIGDIISPPQYSRYRLKHKTNKTPVLDITVEFTYGFVKKLDFVYLAPANFNKPLEFFSDFNLNFVFQLERTSFADNVGKAYIPLTMERGDYKLLYVRKSAQAVNGAYTTVSSGYQKSWKVSVLGTSNTFSLSKVEVEDESGWYSSHRTSVVEIAECENLDDSDQTKLMYQLSLSISEQFNQSLSVPDEHSRWYEINDSRKSIQSKYHCMTRTYWNHVVELLIMCLIDV